jgi:hypothetical protein
LAYQEALNFMELADYVRAAFKAITVQPTLKIVYGTKASTFRTSETVFFK